MAARTTARVLTAGLLTAAVACTEPTTPTPVTPTTVVLAVGGNGKVRVKAFQLSANTIRIDGPSVAADLSIANSGTAIPSGVSIEAVISQPAATREAANTPLVCVGMPGESGKLPTGACDVSFAAKASNSSSTPGVGALVPGSATMTVRVIQAVGGTATELASKSITVNLVTTPALSALTLASTTLAIDGPSTSYTATLQNPANSLQGVLLQGWIVQGPGDVIRRAAGGTLVSCGSSVGLLPPGTCTITFPASATNGGSGTGTLMPGPAAFELQLIQSSGGANTTLDTKTVAITLVSSTPRITSVALQSSIIVIGGAPVEYTATLQNPGFQQTDVLLQGALEQDQGGVTVVKGAGGTYIGCGAGLGVLPTTGQGTCSIALTVNASAGSGGGAFASGPARFVLHLYKAPANVNPTEFDTRIIDVTLVRPTPSIVSLTPASSYVVIDKPGTVTDVSATIYNPGSPFSSVGVQGWIRQGTARRASGGTIVTCGPISGTLPTGTCVQGSVMYGDNVQASGTGTLEPGPATFELELTYYDGIVQTVVDTKTIPITLVANTPSIVSISPATTSLVIDGARSNYTAVVYNPTGAPLAGVLVQEWIDQGTSSSPAGGVVLGCTLTSGVMPPGACTVSFTFGAANTGSTTGLLVPGDAFFRLDLSQSSVVLATKSVPVTLTALPAP